MNNIQNKYQCIPQNDMDCYYNTIWKRMTEMMDLNSVSNFSILEDKINKEMYNFISNAKYGQDPILNNLVKFRDSYDWKNEMYEPIIKLIKDIQNITNITDLSIMIFRLLRINIPTLFTFSVGPHYRYPNNYCIIIGDFPLTLGSNIKYQKMKENRWNDYQKMLQDVYYFVESKWKYKLSNNYKFVENISIFEVLFSKLTLTMEETRDLFLIMNSTTYQDFLEKFDDKDFWKNILGELIDTKIENYISYENIRLLYFLKKFITNMTENDLLMVKDYLVFCVAREYGIFTIELFKTFNQTILGNISEKQLFIELFYLTFGPYLQLVFELEYHNENKINYAYDMFLKMKSYCTEIINTSNMFTGNTKLEAINKITSLDMVVGVQKYHIMLSRLPQLGSNFYQNLMIINTFYFDTMVKMAETEVGRYNLSITNDLYSFMVNAYYEPFSNLIYLPTSMLNNIFLDIDKDPIYNYGSIGIIIAHEMMHCFDTYGSIFNHKGHLDKWWSEGDYQKYMTEILKVEKHYQTLLLYDIPVNPKASISEDIADITGVKISFRTFLRMYFPKLHTNHLTRQQKEYFKKFFESWTKTLREIDDPESIKYNILFGVHSPNIIRVNAPFAHLNEYYQIFDVNDNHLNYLDPVLRTSFFDLE